MQSFTGQVAQDSLGTQQFFPVEKNDVMRHFVNVGYTHDFNKNWNADFNLTFNRIEYNESSDEDTLIGEITVHGSLAENLNMTLGGTSEHTDGTAIDNFQDHVHSLYAQLEWQSTDWLKMVGGLQMNDSENYKVGYSPRLAAIFTPHENWSAKLLYGEAFRAASAIETFVTIPGVLSSTSNVSPEKISTLEGQILYHDMNSSASVSIYRSRITDIIGRENTGLPGNLLITNTGEEVYKGIEFEGKYEIFTGLSIQGSANLQYGKNDEDIYNPTYYPNWMVKAGFVYEADGWSFAAFNSSYGDPEDIRGTNPNVLDVNDASKGYSLISANLNVDVNELAGFHNAPKITFTLHGENLLDEEMNFPDFNRRDVNSYPIDSGRSVYGKISVRF